MKFSLGVRAAILLCTLGSVAQQPSEPPDVRVSVAPTNDPYVFAVSLRNVSGQRLSVVLGESCAETVEAARYTLTKSDGETIDFEDMGLPCAGTVRALAKDLAPGQSYSYNLDVHNTIVSESETFFHLLTSGRELLRIQASVDGQKGIDDCKGINLDKVVKYPIWRGRASSEPVTLAQPPP